MKEFIYVFGHKFYGSKIGVSNNPKNRFKDMTRHSPRPEDFWIEFYASAGDADSIERVIHKALQDRRISKVSEEWFDIRAHEAAHMVQDMLDTEFKIRRRLITKRRARLDLLRALEKIVFIKGGK